MFEFTENTFIDIDDGSKKLTYQAQLSNGQPLPDEFKFYGKRRQLISTPKTLRKARDSCNIFEKFIYKAPLEICIIAKDPHNANVTDTLSISV